MCEYDKNLMEVNNKRNLFKERINKLEIVHPKLYKKLTPIFNDISLWMLDAQSYMNELKKSIDVLENTKVNNVYGGIAYNPIENKKKKNV